VLISAFRKGKRKSVDAWILQRQLEECSGNVRTAALGNLINGAIATYLFAPTFQIGPILVAFAVLILILVWRGYLAHIVARGGLRSSELRRLSWHFTANALASGAFWGSFVGGMMIFTTSADHLFLGILGAGMTSAGALSFRSRQRAATTYVLCSAPGPALGLIFIGTPQSFGALGLLVCYLVVLLNNIKTTAQNFETRAKQERELAKSSDTIQLLLNDYTEQASDWLIELNDEFQIVNPSLRLAQAARRPVEVLEGKPLTSLFDRGDGYGELSEHLVVGRAFRRVIVSLTIEGELHWWSISARPGGPDGIAYRCVVTDITAQRLAEDKVSYMAHYDGLTDLPNRTVFGESLYHALNRDHGRAGLIFFDLDQFKSVNDTLGHVVGDKLLRQVARRLEQRLHKRELLSRLGGDEFAILVRADRLSEIETIAESIRDALCEPFSIDAHDVVIGASIGMSIAPDHASDTEGLFRTSDLALYAAKAQGRNRAIMFEPAMDEAARERRQLETDLRLAIANNEMRLHYQPLVNIDTGKPTAFEALVRWEHPTRGIVLPGLFIAVAEENGMIVQIGEWVIRQALDDLATWEEHIGISINLSPAQMRSPSLLTTVIHGLARNQIDPKRVCLEITESVLLHDSEANMETLHRLRGLGIQIALDDFGTGYSSLNYLRSFPFDKIKIDRCFVEDIDTREDCLAIVRSVVSLANSLGMTTIAEGVEREEQAQALRDEGCGELQGFLYSKAVPADQLTDLRKPKLRLDQMLVQLEDERLKALAKSGSAPENRAAAR
jgi:diguanylate cyclase (GGDEF)-like protein